MEMLRDYDPHEDLRLKLQLLSRQMEELEAELYRLKDAFFHHERGDPDLEDAQAALARRANP